MNDKLIAARVYSCSVLAQLKLQAMVAENQRRMRNGEAQAYCEDSFFAVHDELHKVLTEHSMDPYIITQPIRAQA